MNLSLQRAPRAIARNAISEQRGNAVLEEDGGSVNSPPRLVFLEATGVVSRGIEPSPENRQSVPPRLPNTDQPRGPRLSCAIADLVSSRIWSLSSMLYISHPCGKTE